MKRIALCCIMAVVAWTAWAQDLYHVKTYGKTDELRVRGATCITQLEGFVWIGTSRGFGWFDGSRMHPYSIPDEDGMGDFYSRVSALAAGENTNLWIGSKRGVYVFDVVREKLTEFKPQGFPNRANVHTLCFDKSGNLWVIANRHLYRMDVKGGKAYPVGDELVSPSCLCVTRDGTVWMGDNEGLLYRYDAPSRRLRAYSVKPEGVDEFHRIVSITEMGDGRLAVVSNTHGVCLFSPKTFKSGLLLTRDDENTPIVAHTSISPDGKNLWIGSERGVVIYNMENGQVSGIRQSRISDNMLSDNAVHSLFVDREGGVWVGTFFGGMHRISLTPRNFSVFLPENGTTGVNVVREICADRYGRLWVGTEDGGLYLFNRDTNEFHVADVKWPAAGEPFNVQALMLMGDELWVSSLTRGVYVIDTRTKQLLRHYEKTNKTPTANPIGAISLCHQRGTVFVGSSQGVYVYDREQDCFNMLPGMSDIYAHHLYADRHGNVWVASFDKGLWKLQQDKGQWKGRQTPFEYKCTSVIIEDHKGYYWVGTDTHGLMRYDDRTGKTDRVETSERLAVTTVTNILEDHWHRLWISTFDGLFSYNMDKNVVRHFTTSDGLPSPYLNYSSGYVDESGNVYIGTYHGMVRFNPTAFVLSHETLQPHMLNLYVHGKHVLPNDDTGILEKALPVTREISLAHDQNTFTITYAVPTYQTGNAVWYRYRMRKDEPWVVTESAQAIHLNNLSTGSYEITLQASYNPERWDGEPAVLKLTVAPPTALSPLAILGYAFVLVMLVVIIMSIIRRKEEKKDENE